ncbi:sulfite exporter TauE/SafE family protein [Haloarchaeobius sp. TZWSO28]|uniref:sulfite exporter TauE/SafE family protein n=1 Tax=Haloarchaeobius sp. TZWSO28 TaxID=3446119 RepID=UPI003EBE7E34
MVPDPATLGVFLVVGLLAGAHCLGMCGPLVTLYADRMGADRERVSFRDLRQHLLFNFGRTLSYAAIGGLMGLLGMLVFDAAAVTPLADGLRGVTGVLVGGFILVTGAGYLFRGRTVGHGVSIPLVGSAFQRVYGALTTHVDSWVRGPRIVGLGAVHGLLPCPIIYPAYLYALATGSPLAGGLSLGVLGLGTIPTLFAYGTLFQSADARWRSHLHRALGAAFLVLGYIPLSHGLMLLGIHVPHVPLPMPGPTIPA